MANYWSKQPSSRVIRGQELDWTGSGTLVTTNLNSQCVQVRIVSDVRGYVSFQSTSISSSSRDTAFAEIFPNNGMGEYFTVAANSVIAWSSSSTSSGSILISECA